MNCAMIKDISDFNNIPGIFLFYQLAGSKWWILSLWDEQVILSAGREQHGGISPPACQRDGGLQRFQLWKKGQGRSNKTAVLQICMFGLFWFVLFFKILLFSSHTSGISELFQSQQGGLSRGRCLTNFPTR